MHFCFQKRYISISINPLIYFVRFLCLYVYLFLKSATLQPFKIWFVVSCLLPCNSLPACKHSLLRSDADFPRCGRLVCVKLTGCPNRELSRNFSEPQIEHVRFPDHVRFFKHCQAVKMSMFYECFCMFSPEVFNTRNKLYSSIKQEKNNL